jgi:hypothetical protein
LATLGLDSVYSYTKTDKTSNSNPIEIQALQKKFQPRWSLQAGLLSENFSRINGASIAQLVHFPLNHRWDLTTGIGLTYLDQATVTINPTDTVQLESVTGSDPEYDNTLAVSENSTDFTDQHSYFLIEIPVMATYHMSPQWSVFGGATNSFLLQGSSDEALNQIQIFAEDRSGLSNKVYYTEYSYPMYTLSGVVGTRYQFPSGFYCWGQYQHAIPFEKGPVQFANNRFSAGLGFSF